METTGIKTRFLILSDTHSMDLPSQYINHPNTDVVIHCGDLTESSKLQEYRTAIQLLQKIPASLKLVIAGNHDISLDEPCFRQKVADARSRHQLPDRFALANGASLTVYASPCTPVDVVLTHGPPRGVLDIPFSGYRAGCARLFEAVARSRPRLHCFGHIHEAWGAKLVTWRKTVNGSSFCCHTSHCAGDPNPLQRGLQTLFVNAAVEGSEEVPIQLPWLVDIELAPA
ncbi:metallophosphatase domain-containing protein [Aspergillus ibericus CBS 121593]|uniref:Metallo-dependent phosphatase n=1 Tax=Aspergillus ibericus CBS 121593 TaxID=1448316 RepID=A0A395H4D8_9EURO|nr:Metallo-dependent phosphatase [Aspergillus ibericus CBS 121593]RAL02309.1 Metallo-dependent phosphatase [Aspergillus ibericus CBS 121593]